MHDAAVRPIDLETVPPMMIEEEERESLAHPAIIAATKGELA